MLTLEQVIATHRKNTLSLLDCEESTINGLTVYTYKQYTSVGVLWFAEWFNGSNHHTIHNARNRNEALESARYCINR